MSDDGPIATDHGIPHTVDVAEGARKSDLHGIARCVAFLHKDAPHYLEVYWVVISGGISPLIWLISVDTLLVTPFRTTHEPPSSLVLSQAELELLESQLVPARLKLNIEVLTKTIKALLVR